MNELRHLAIIMDGNGRWAKQHNKTRPVGHREGAKVVRNITIWASKNRIPFLSLYAFSTENWTRPKIEVDFLMKLLEKYLEEEIKTYTQNNIRFLAIGDVSVFSKKIKNLIQFLQETTAQNTALTQILALNYGSKDELARTFLKIFRAESNAITLHTKPKDIIAMIENNLDTANIPAVDLLIRTGGEMRLSNFMLYQSSYAELYFSQTMFPDFTTKELDKIIKEYKHRTRRFGGL